MNRNRLALLGGSVAAAVVVVVVLIVVAGGGSKKATTTVSTTAGSPTSRPVFQGIPQHGDTLGNPAAPATLVVYEDPQCPFCRDFALGALPSVVTDYVRTGKLKLVYRGIEIIGPNSEPGLRAIYAAGKQNRLWNLAEALYHVQGAENSGWITTQVIRAAATAAGANASAVIAASSSASVAASLAQANRDAAAAKVQGTPTFVIERPPGLPQQLQVPALDAATFEAALAQALQ